MGPNSGAVGTTTSASQPMQQQQPLVLMFQRMQLLQLQHLRI
jgi:hypothetical protein